MRVMGLDIGDRRIGVAISDPLKMLATPLTIIERRDESSDIGTIAALVKHNEVESVVAGLPRSLNGNLGEQAKKVQEFIEVLSRKLNIPLEYRDERLSTVSAKRLMQSAATKKSRKKIFDDAAAAAVILQSYLDELEFRRDPD